MRKLYDELKNFFPNMRDPRKLLANTWWISDEKTRISTTPSKYHPWVCIDTQHPDISIGYNMCLGSTHPGSKKWTVEIPPNVIHGLRKRGYVCISVIRPFSEDIINSGKHIGDMPDDIKQKILEKLESWRSRRKM